MCICKGVCCIYRFDTSNVDEELQKLIQTSPNKLRGIRRILDCVGKFEGGKTATHLATSRHDGIDYLKASKFERGLAMLSKYNLLFDLQCAPIQLSNLQHHCLPSTLYSPFAMLGICFFAPPNTYCRLANSE